MNFIEQYVKYNEFFRIKLNQYIKSCQKYDYNTFLKLIEDSSIDLEGTIYKLLADETEMFSLDSGNYELLPLGLINRNVPLVFIDDLSDDEKPNIRGNTFHKLLFTDPVYEIFYYPDDKVNIMDKAENNLVIDHTFDRICQSYIKHYGESLQEEWSERDFYEMLKSLKYLTVKYAKNIKTGELMAVGFFGTQVRNGAGGEALTNAELYVLPEFRGIGIAKKIS